MFKKMFFAAFAAVLMFPPTPAEAQISRITQFFARLTYTDISLEEQTLGPVTATYDNSAAVGVDAGLIFFRRYRVGALYSQGAVDGEFRMTEFFPATDSNTANFEMDLITSAYFAGIQWNIVGILVLYADVGMADVSAEHIAEPQPAADGPPVPPFKGTVSTTMLRGGVEFKLTKLLGLGVEMRYFNDTELTDRGESIRMPESSVGVTLGLYF